MLWGRGNSYPNPALSFKEGDAGQICPACIPGPAALISLPPPTSSPDLACPYPPMQTLSPVLPRKLRDTKHTTATAMVCQSPVLTLLSLALKVTAEERD